MEPVNLLSLVLHPIQRLGLDTGAAVYACIGDSISSASLLKWRHLNFHSLRTNKADTIPGSWTIKPTEHCNLLQLDTSIFSTQAWCSADILELDVSKTKFISFSRETNLLIYDYKHCLSSTNRTDSLKDLEYFFIIFITTSTMLFLIVFSCWL